MIDAAFPDYRCTPVSARRARFGYAPAPEGTPHVSIVTPFFNTGAQFRETAESVFRQSMQQWEWLIVNDGSTDPESAEVLNAYRTSDRRVRIIDQPVTSGPSAARNRGFEAAEAELVLQLDSDNLIEPTALEKWCWYLDTHPECAFVNGYSVGFGAQQYLWNHGFELGREFLRRNRADGTALVRREVHRQVGGYDERIRGGLEDWDFWLRCANGRYWGDTIPEFLIWYRRRDHHLNRWTDWDEGKRQRSFRNRLRESYPSLWTQAFPAGAVESTTFDAPIPENWPFDNRLSKQKRRLLLVVPWYSVGGADQFNIDLLEQLIRRDWEVTVASTMPGDDRWLSRFTAATPDVFSLPRFLRPADYPRFLTYLIRSRSVDAVLISHSEFAYRALPYLRQACPDVTYLDYVHTVEPTWNDGGYPALSLQYCEQLDLSVVTSRHLKRWMVERGASPHRIEPCYINVDANVVQRADEQREATRRELGVAPDVPVILFVGRICAQKQPLVIVETLRQLKRLHPIFKAWIAGDGPDMPRLRSGLTRAGLNTSVSVLGEIRHEEVLRLMAAADLFFLPSKYEGIASVLFEAMAAGLPVVSADVGGQRELVTEECGVLLVPGDPRIEAAQYAAVLADLLRAPQRRAAMRLAARERIARHFSIGQMGDRMTELLARADELRLDRQRAVTTADASQHIRTAIEQATRAKHEYLVRDADISRRLNVRMHAVLSSWFSPVHDWANRRGWSWVSRAGVRARSLLLGHRELLR